MYVVPIAILYSHLHPSYMSGRANVCNTYRHTHTRTNMHHPFFLTILVSSLPLCCCSMQLRQAEARNERKAYEKHLRQDEKQKAAAPPSYDKAMSHEVVDDTAPLV